MSPGAAPFEWIKGRRMVGHATSMTMTAGASEGWRVEICAGGFHLTAKSVFDAPETAERAARLLAMLARRGVK
ncbi:MAG TPA: hypothetical protein VGP44_02500 [Gemmatimonadales bacterium]|nr:hypothetical protein [Gemmatimonadales bacterium]